ncbi:similar to stage IV sporulation protein [Thermoactinomyces sp. DSM 45891]|uniref:sporulation protein YqfD n=1 Tax=Thermoactinomyces sp. DSM 45891 TaxID=1761907 RepID=UPI000913ED50|nr:sporulation protein YqfD [Thermoactinomyces sp. DSM 45891]SFX66568.1 similar to stage IV sporulation protein [Thermoactinomyces sp. DSM 45891]
MPNQIEGEITIECRGAMLTPFLNDVVQAGIVLKQIEWKRDELVQITMLVPDFKRVISLLRQHGCKMKIVKKSGLPFLVAKAMRRKFFAIGTIIFISLLYMMSSLVWKIDILGNEKIPTQLIQNLLQKEGVYPGQWKGKIPSQEELKQNLLDQLPQATWIGIQMQGTRVVVTVVEKKGVDQATEPTKVGPVNLVAKKDAFVVDLAVEKGNPLVKVNDTVQRGQVLVSGKYGDPTIQEGGQIVGAKGTVMGEVWYESNIVVPMQMEYKKFTGNRRTKTVPMIGTWQIRNPFSEDHPYQTFEIVSNESFLQIGKWRFPIGWIKEEYMETELEKRVLSPAQAVEAGMSQAKAEILNVIGKDGRIISQKILQQSIKSGRVYLKINFDVVENIAVSKPLLQGE